MSNRKNDRRDEEEGDDEVQLEQQLEHLDIWRPFLASFQLNSRRTNLA